MSYRNAESKIVPLERIGELAESLRRAKKSIVTTNGCFDLLHWGHLKYLEEARLLGDVLICGLNSDRSVKILKGDSRPLVTERYRVRQLAALESIDFVAVFEEETPERFLRMVRPDIHVKGGDYADKPLPERQVVEGLGGKIVCLPFVEGLSTTSLIEKIRRL